jgi:ABC-type phosphate transport system permease subunit
MEKPNKISGANPSAICDSIIFGLFVYLVFIYYFICQAGLLTSALP